MEVEAEDPSSAEEKAKDDLPSLADATEFGRLRVDIFEEISTKEKCERCYGKDPEYVHPDDGDPYSDIYEVCPDCNRSWNEGGPEPQ